MWRTALLAALGRNTRQSVLAACAVLTSLALIAADDPNVKLKAAKDALQKAQAAEKANDDARYSLDMARAATGAIVAAMNETIARAQALLKEVQDQLNEATREAKELADAAAREPDAAKKKALEQEAAEAVTYRAGLEQLVAARVTRIKSYQEQLAKDQGVADRAAALFTATDRKHEDTVLQTWDATRAVHAAELEVAKYTAEKAAAERLAAQKVLDQKIAEAKAAADKVIAAEKTFRETEAIAAWDAQDYATIVLGRLEQELRAKTAAAQTLTQQAAAEKDPAKKKELEATAAKANADKAALEKSVAEKRAAIEAGAVRVYELRVAALGGLKPLAPKDWNYQKAHHLLVRAGFGGTPQDVQKLADMGLYKAVDHMVKFHLQPPAEVAFDAVPPPANDPLAGRLRIPGAAARAVAATSDRSAAYGGQQDRLVRWWLKRMVESPRPLQEKLTLFWHGHFATQASVVNHSYATYQHNQLLREHAAGSFAALLYGIVHDPVMIRYLDNNSNVKGHANENLAREIMELFAMGAYQGYNEVDVREAARALTGYTFESQVGQFRFVGTSHDEGPKKVFGREGAWTGDDLVRLILEQPTTARFIAGKLFEFFAYADPSPETVDRLATMLRAHNYELSPMLQNLFLSQDFYSEKAMGTQIQCPVQLVVGTLRTLGVKQVADPGMLHGATSAMGQQVLEPPDVKGWRYGRSWISSSRVFERYNQVANLVRNVPQPARRGIDVAAFVQAGGCKNAGEVVDYLIKTCYVAPLDAQKRAKLADFAKDLPPMDQWAKQADAVNAKLQELVVLITSSPEYQVH